MKVNLKDPKAYLKLYLKHLRLCFKYGTEFKLIHHGYSPVADAIQCARLEYFDTIEPYTGQFN